MTRYAGMPNPSWWLWLSAGLCFGSAIIATAVQSVPLIALALAFTLGAMDAGLVVMLRRWTAQARVSRQRWAEYYAVSDAMPDNWVARQAALDAVTHTSERD